MTGKYLETKTILELTFPADNLKSPFATEQFYTLLHLLSRKLSLWQKLIGLKNEYSLEIVATKNDGIRYLLVTKTQFAENIRRNLLAYIPGVKIKKIDDYLENLKTKPKIVELGLTNHFSLGLVKYSFKMCMDIV